MKILLHVISPDKIGGTRTVWRDIKDSYLNQKYELIDFVQDELCGMNPIKSIRFINKYRKLINEQHADLIHITGLGYSAFLMTIAAKLSNVRNILMSIHAYTTESTSLSSMKRFLFGHIIEPLCLNLSSGYFTVCKSALSNDTIKRSKREKMLGVVYNKYPDVDCSKLTKGSFRNELGITDNNTLIVSIVGRVVKDKGHRYIIDAIKKYNSSNTNMVFVVVGSGNYLDVYKEELNREISKKEVILLGNRSDIPQILYDTDIFLFASLHENHSKVLLEAANMECAIVATSVGGNVEIIDDGRNGILIPPRDSDAIVSALDQLQSEGLRETLKMNAVEDLSSKFSEENTIGELDKIYTMFNKK